MRQKFTQFWPIWDVSYFPKREFFGKVDQHYFGPTIAFHHATSFQKGLHRADHEKKVVQLLPELLLVQKEIFFEKLPNTTDV